MADPSPGPKHGDRSVAASVDELIAGATERVPLSASDGKSGSIIERLRIDGESFVLKCSRYSSDWLMQTTGDRNCRQLALWRSGLMDRFGAFVDHTVVGVAPLPPDGMALLMRDVSGALVPEGDTSLGSDAHDVFVDAMAAMHAELWGWHDDIGLTTVADRYSMFAPSRLRSVIAAGVGDGVPTIARGGWDRLAARSSTHAETLIALAEDPAPLVDALRSTPLCFVHGDWKAGNLGLGSDGRVVLLDWAYPGSAAGCSDLAWYLSLNSARLPVSKEATIESYRASLECRGVDTEPWWESQLALCLLGAAVQFGWEKALGAEAELDWWLAAADAGLLALRAVR